jgi:hypothetical protein
VASPPEQLSDPTRHEARPLYSHMRFTMVGTAWFLLVLGLDLTLAPGRTDEFFSWPIEPSLTAAAIGAFYVAGFVLLITALKESTWARGRTVILGGVAFAVLAIIATFIDLDKFAFDSDEPVAVVVAWVWISTYMIVPLLLLGLLVPQSRVPGVDPRTGPPPRWLSASLWVTGAIAIAVAAGLTVIPEDMADIWPWTLTPLTARVLGSWIGGFGIVFLWGAWENDRFRALPAVAALGFVGLIQLLTVARFGDQISWDEPGAWIYVVVLGAALAAGTMGWVHLRQADLPTAAADPSSLRA